MLVTTHVLHAQSSCTPTVEVTPASCPGSNDGSIEVTPPTNCGGEGCYTATPTPIENCSSCSRSVSGTNGVTINNGEKVCVQAGASISGNLTFSGSGTLVVCGNANFQNINLNGSGFRRIIVLGSITIPSMNMGGMELHNYGNFNITQGLSVEGLFNNYGTVSVASHFNINASYNGRMYNYGALNVGTDMNDLNIFENRGTVSVGNNLTLNSPTAMLNTCQITVGKDFTINSGSDLDQRGIITVGAMLRLNGNSTIFMKGSTRITAGKLAAGGTLLQHNGGAGCSLLQINGSSNLNAPITFSGNLSFCPSGGFESATRPTYNNGAQQSCTACTPPSIPPGGAVVSWPDFGITGPTLSGVGPGDYTLEVVCGDCTYSTTVAVTSNSNLLVSATVGADGTSATATPSGGVMPYSYSWNNVTSGGSYPNAATISGLTPGTYVVTVTDASGCEVDDTVIIAPGSCNPNSDVNPISCFGANDGSITITDAGCTSPEIKWLDFGLSGETITNLSPGTYFVRIECPGVCLDTLSFSFTEPAQLSVVATVNAGGTIGLTVNGGTPSYTYSWTDSFGVEVSNQADPGILPMGDYTITVTDSRGCQGTDAISITEDFPSCTPSDDIIPVSCFGLADGRITLSGLCEEALITWSNGASGPVLNGLSAGVYTVTILCEACSFTKSYEVTSPPPISVTATAVGFGAELLVTGGTGPYLYEWRNNGALVSTEKDPELLPGGENTVLVVDFNGCSGGTSVVVDTPPCAVDITVNQISCDGENDGSIIVSTTGCPGGSSGGCFSGTVVPQQTCNNCSLSIQGSRSNVNVSNGQKVCLLNGASIGNLTINGGNLVVCGNAFLQNVSFNGSGTIVVHGSLGVGNINFNNSNSKIYNYGSIGFNGYVGLRGELHNYGTITCSYDLSINDGVGKAYNFGDLIVKGNLSNHETFENRGPLQVGTQNYHSLQMYSGSYTLNTCSINISGGLQMDASSVFDHQGQISIGGDVNINNSSVLRLLGGTRIAAMNFNANNSTIQRTEGFGCSRVQVNGNTNLNQMTVSGEISFCDLNGIENNNASYVNGAGANCSCNPPDVPPTSQGPTVYLSQLRVFGDTFEDLGPGIYSVVVSCDSCAYVENIDITEPLELIPSAVLNNDGSVTAVVTGGTPPYQWDTPVGTFNTNQPTILIVGLPLGVNTLTVTDANGCSKPIDVTVDLPNCDDGTIDYLVKDETCFDASDGEISILDVGCAEGNPTYSWDGPGVVGETSPTLANLSAGEYHVTITCSQSCKIKEDFTVKRMPLLLIDSLFIAQQPSCPAAFDGAVGAAVSGGSGMYTYKWVDSWHDVSNTLQATNLLPGVYFFEVKDAKNPECLANDNILLEAGETTCGPCDNFSISVRGKGPSCPGLSDGYLRAFVTGSSTYTYEWSTGETGSPQINNLSDGVYSVEVTDAEGNSCFEKVFLKESNPFHVDIVPSGSSVCPGQNVSLTAVSSAPVTFVWTPGNSTGNVLVVNTPGTYTVTAYDGAGCTDIESFTLVAGTDETCLNCFSGINLAPKDPSCHGMTDGKITVTVEGGSGDYKYVWNTGADTKNLENLGAGTYSLSVTDVARSCTGSSTPVVLNNPAPLSVQITGDPFVCQGGTTTLSASGSIGNYHWLNINETTQTIQVDKEGTYRVEVRNGICSALSDPYRVEKQPDEVSVFGNQGKLCPGDSMVLVSSYNSNNVWSTGETTRSIHVDTPGPYTVTVKIGDCMSASGSFLVEEAPPEECAVPDPCEPLLGTPIDITDNCVQFAINVAVQNARDRYEGYISQQRKDFRKGYIEKCLKTQENFTMEYEEQEHHYTLYYYDQAGNLERTVPPQGVKIISDPSVLSQIKSDRINGNRTVETTHDYLTSYSFNSLNSGVTSKLPDQGNMENDRASSRNWYDEVGRPVLIQTAFHYQQSPPRYLYTLYDKLNRIVETGEVRSTVDLSTIVSETNPSQVVSSAFLDWIADETKYEVSRSYYDYQVLSVPGFVQERLRNRVSATTYERADVDNDSSTYDYATHFSYDIHGLARKIVQDNPTLDHLPGQRYKTIEYVYDLVSQNVLEIQYQRGQPDQFYHRNFFDADNRLVEVQTSSDYIHWDRDVKQFYYDHGELARKEIGHDKVQGIDYAYTIQGWTKGVNSNSLVGIRDIGKDGVNGPNQFIPQDEFGYSLGYFSGDYTPIFSFNTNFHFLMNQQGSEIEANTKDMFNGNISQMTTSIRQFMKDNEGPLAQTFAYDQLHRLKESRNFQDNTSGATNQWSGTGTATDRYNMKLTYDANGNILTLKRNAHTGTTPESDGLDDLIYYYENKANGYSKNTNKLLSVEDQRDHSGNAELDEIDDIRPGQKHD